MSNSRGAVAYAAYSAAVGGKTFDGRDMPAWDQLGDKIQAGWTAAAESAGFPFAVGQSVQCTNGVSGRIRTLCFGKDRHGAWIEGVDNTGRPFEHYAEEGEITP